MTLINKIFTSQFAIFEKIIVIVGSIVAKEFIFLVLIRLNLRGTGIHVLF